MYLEQENKMLSETLHQRNQDLYKKEHQIKSLEKQLLSLQNSSKHDICLEEAAKLKRKIEDQAFELSISSQSNDEKKASLKYKEEEIRQLKLYLEQSNKEIEILKQHVCEERGKSEGFNITLRNQSFLEEQIRISKGQYEDSINRERQLYKEIEQMRGAIQKSEEKHLFSLKKLESLHVSKQTIENENSKLQKNLAECMQRDNGKLIEINKLEAKVQQFCIENEDLRREINRMHDHAYELERELTDKQRSVENEKNNGNVLSGEVEKLKDLTSTLERYKCEQIEKIERMQMIDEDKEKLIKRLREELMDLKKQLVMSESICTKGVETQELQARQIESLKYDVSKKNDELMTLRNSLKIYMSEHETYKNQQKVLRDEQVLNTRSIRDLETENSRLKDLNQALNLQSENQQKTILKLQGQVQELNNNLQNNLASLQKSEEKGKSLNYEYKNAAERIEEMNRDLRSKVDIIGNLTKENQEITKRFEESIEEYESLARKHEYLDLELRSISGKCENLEIMNEGLKKQEEIYLRSLKSLEEDLRASIKNAEISDFKRSEAERILDKLNIEMHNARFLNRDLDSNIEDMYRKINSVENERSFYETRCKAAENEILSLRSQLDAEKQKSENYESRFILEKESIRKQEYEEERLRTFKQTNPDLISELYKQIEAYKRESLGIEMEYMKVNDECMKTKKMLHEAEARIAELEISRR